MQTEEMHKRWNTADTGKQCSAYKISSLSEMVKPSTEKKKQDKMKAHKPRYPQKLSTKPSHISIEEQ